jgi:hypothetical protein
VLSSDPELGTILLAVRDFSIGDEVLREEPFISYRSDLQAILLYHRSSSEDKKKFMEFYHRDSPNLTQFEESRLYLSKISRLSSVYQGELLERYNVEMSVTEIFKVLSVISFNCHQFVGSSTEYAEKVITQGNTSFDETKRSALFYYGSKVAHSCEPNLIYTSKRIKGCMSYLALKEIKMGEMLTFDYALDNNNTVKPTIARQLKLRE